MSIKYRSFPSRIQVTLQSDTFTNLDRYVSSILGLGALAQISRVFKENDRRLLFRGWSRLCLHVASHHAGGTATATPTERTNRAGAGATEMDGPVPMDRDATDAAEARQRLQAAEKNARAHARRADAMEKRAVAATERVRELENAAGIPTTGGALLERAEEAERAVQQQERRQAIRLVRTRAIEKDAFRFGVGLMNVLRGYI